MEAGGGEDCAEKVSLLGSGREAAESIERVCDLGTLEGLKEVTVKST